MTAPHTVSRRVLLGGGLGLAAVAAGGGLATRALSGLGPWAALAAPAASTRGRVLVVLELAGGNDGLSVLVPYGDPHYHDLRRRTAPDPAELLPLRDGMAIHAGLSALQRRGLAVIQGVGVRDPDLSHFEMLHRWWIGDPSGRSDVDSGILGRLCDAVGEPSAPAVGVSIGTSPTPALVSRRVTTAALAGAQDHLGASDGLAPVWRAALRGMAQPDRDEATAILLGRTSTASALRLVEVVEALPPPGPGYPDTDLATQLRFAAQLVAAHAGVRVVHVPVGADFDTHADHRARSAANLRLVDGAVDAFLRDLEQRHLDDRVLVLMWSEFGRRAADNGDSGLDHGAASIVLLAGAVRPGVYGEPPRLDRLDGDGNPVATVGMEEVYATVVELWMGVPAKEILLSPASPLPGIV